MTTGQRGVERPLWEAQHGPTVCPKRPTLGRRVEEAQRERLGHGEPQLMLSCQTAPSPGPLCAAAAQIPKKTAELALLVGWGGFKPLILNASTFLSVCAGFRLSGTIKCTFDLWSKRRRRAILEGSAWPNGVSQTPHTCQTCGGRHEGAFGPLGAPADAFLPDRAPFWTLSPRGPCGSSPTPQRAQSWPCWWDGGVQTPHFECQEVCEGLCWSLTLIR